jgi:hypothetical protein
MRTWRIIGIVGSSVAVIFAANAAFAQERSGPGPVEPVARIASTTPRGDWGGRMGSTTEERLQAIRTEAQTRIAALKQKAEERIAKIQDRTKQQVAKRVAGQFDDLDKKWTDHFGNELDHDQAVLGKIQDRANAAAAAGKDVTAVNTAVATAQSAIATARAAVALQAAKTYTLASTTPSNVTATSTPAGQQALIASLRTQFQSLHQSLFADLMALRDGSMKDAGTAVQAALNALKQVPGIDEVQVQATSTPSNQ